MTRLSYLVLPKFSLLLLACILSLSSLEAQAQCDEVATGLRNALGITQSSQGNLIVSETGDGTLHSGRISIVETDGTRRTLLNGLPSAINDVGEPSGPAGVYMRGRTLYLAMGIGDSILAGASPGLADPNPSPSSLLFSSVLAITFGTSVENNTTGFSLTPAGQLTLAMGESLTLSNVSGKLTIQMVANFPNFTPNPPPVDNVRGSNPFDLTVAGNYAYVTDGGQNAVWKVELGTGAFTKLVTFPNVPNPLFGTIGGPTSEAVPTGIAYASGSLLVTLFTGFPFPPGASLVAQVDPSTGTFETLLGGPRPFQQLKTAIDVIQIGGSNNGNNLQHLARYLVLQHSSGFGPFFGGPGVVLQFAGPGGIPALVDNCLTRPTSMVLDGKTNTLYITELGPEGPPSGPSRVVSISLGP